MISYRRQFLDDAFLAFSLFAEHNFVMVYDPKEHIIRYSPGAVKIFNLPSEYIDEEAKQWIPNIHPEDKARSLETMRELRKGTILTYDRTYRCKIWDGSYSHFRFKGSVIRDDTGSVGLIVGFIINEGKLEYTDANTMLYNKDKFLSDLSELLLAKTPCFILLLGVNELSFLNRDYNYNYGNIVLQQIAWLIQEIVGTKGVVYRMKGQRFAIMSKELDEIQMREIYAKIYQKLSIGIDVEEGRQTLTTNGGLFLVNNFQISTPVIYDCLKNVYKESKLFHDGTLVVFNSKNTKKVNDTIAIIEHIRQCILNDCENFYLEYQPMLSKEDGKIIGLETLLRWKDETFGFVPTASYIQILSHDFAFEELGIWILRQTMLECKPIIEANPDIFICVNIAVRQLRDPLFPNSIEELLEHTKFPAQNLCLELSSRCRSIPIETLIKRLSRLEQKGIHICFDDFGTGYGSLEIFQDVPVNIIKIDPALLQKCTTSNLAKKDLINICKISHSHNVEVGIKNIETDSQQKELNDIPYSYSQGYYCAYPMRIDALKEYLAAKK